MLVSGHPTDPKFNAQPYNIFFVLGKQIFLRKFAASDDARDTALSRVTPQLTLLYRSVQNLK